MRTHIKFSELGKLPAETQTAALQAAIDFELAKPQLAIDLLGGKVALPGKGFITSTRIEAPNVETIKAYLGRKYAVPSDSPILTDLASEFAQFFHTNMPEVDTGWTVLFDLVDLRQSTHDHFDIVDTNAGITYEQIAPGAAIKKRTQISESKTNVGVVTYGAGLGILDDWITRQQFWKIDEAIAEFRAKHFDKMAEAHYGLLTALGAGIDVAFATDAATTFNAAAGDLLRKVRGAGYAVSQNAQFYIVTSPEKVGYALQMLEARAGSAMIAYGTQKQPIAYNVAGVVASTYIPAADTGYYLVLPGRKLKRGLWKDLGIEQARNAAARASDFFASAQYNAAVGDQAQVRRVKFA